MTAINADASAFLYSVYLGGSADDFGYGIAVDPAGNAYVVGQTSSTDFPVVSALQTNLAGGSDAFVAKIQPGAPSLVAAPAGSQSSTQMARVSARVRARNGPTLPASAAAWTAVLQPPVTVERLVHRHPPGQWRRRLLPPAPPLRPGHLHYQEGTFKLAIRGEF